MKRFSFAAAICSALAILASCSRSTTIDIHLAGLKDGAELILADGADFDYEPVAEATVEKGSAVFKLDLSEPRAFRILPKGGYGGDVIGVSPKGTVKVEGNALLSESENERRMLTVTDMTVQGSEAHAQLVANIPDRNEMNRRFEAIQVKHQDIIGRMSVIKKGSEEWNAMMASDEWKAYELYHDKGFEIVSISADSDKDAWLEALAKENLQWPNDLDGKQGICKLYNVQFYPTVYLLDNNACVLASNDDIRGENLRTKLAELFAE